MFSATTKEAANNTLSSANATANDAKSTVYSAKRDLRDAGEDVSNEFAVAARKAGKQIRGIVDSASDQIIDASDKVTGEIRNNPVRSSAIALGVGFILGALFRK